MSVGKTLARRRSFWTEADLLRKRNPALGIFLWSRGTIWIAALFALLVFQPNRNPAASYYDAPFLHDLGYVTDVWARADSKWYVGIAQHGYHWSAGAPNFFPLYPFAMSLLGHALFGHFVLSGILISLAACLVAFALLYRIAEDKLGPEGAYRAVLYLAIFPMSVFLQAVYTESLYLALVLGAFFFAERQRWLNAWIATGLAVLTRSSGVALVPALVLLAWRAPDRRRAFAGLPLVPALFSVFPLVLRHQTGDPWGFLHAPALWRRHFAPGGPIAGIWAGVHDGIAGFGRLLTEGPALRSSTATGSDYQIYTAAFNVQALVFLAVFSVLAVIAWRRFGDAYALFAALSLAIPLSTPVSSTGIPLQSLPRYVTVIFPCFLALAWIGRRPGVHTVIIAVSSILLGLSVVQWSLWQWVG